MVQFSSVQLSSVQFKMVSVCLVCFGGTVVFKVVKERGSVQFSSVQDGICVPGLLLRYCRL